MSDNHQLLLTGYSQGGFVAMAGARAMQGALPSSAFFSATAAAPDGGFPTLTTGIPATSPGNTLRQALKTNDLRDWVPTAPLLLCGGDSDPTLFFLNTTLLQHYWTSNPPTAAVAYVDVDSTPTANDPHATFKDAFAAAKVAVAVAAVLDGATDEGRLAVLKAYHATLVAPACIATVQKFFDGY